MSKAKEDAKVYREAAELNREDPLLDGSTLWFPDFGQLVVTGDLHGHRRNLERIQSFCDLKHAPMRHVILHELIHEEITGSVDMSHELLLEAAKWKCRFPDQIHFLQSNHELAQLTGQEISKGGKLVTYSFLAGVRETYGKGCDEIAEATLELLASYPLAGRTPNRVMISHSLPNPRQMDQFDLTVFDRLPTPEDLHDGGSAYLLVWGRYQNRAQLDQLAAELDVDFFLCGHQPQEEGYEIVHDRMIILASDHNHGVLLPLDLKKPQDLQSLEAAIKPLASIA